MVIHSYSDFYPHHPYGVQFRQIFTPSEQVEEKIEWCRERLGRRAYTPYRDENCHTARWMVLVTFICFQDYEDAFEFSMRWG